MIKDKTFNFQGERLMYCVCPNCAYIHKMWIYWAGRGATPKKLCERCRINLGRNKEQELDENRVHTA